MELEGAEAGVDDTCTLLEDVSGLSATLLDHAQASPMNEQTLLETQTDSTDSMVEVAVEEEEEEGDEEEDAGAGMGEYEGDNAGLAPTTPPLSAQALPCTTPGAATHGAATPGATPITQLNTPFMTGGFTMTQVFNATPIAQP